MPDISVLILTLNEERNIGRCLAALSWSDDVVVFDSYSTDRTVEIAQEFGARVIQRRFDDERTHRTESLKSPFRHTWVFNPDADEVATAELCQEMCDAVAMHGSTTAAFRVRRRDMFMGRWIRHSSLYPTWLVRLFRPEAVRLERTINLRYVIDGAERKLNHHLLHYSFNNGLDAWVAKHNTYSRAEAIESLCSLTGTEPKWGGLLSRDPVLRRACLKEMSVRTPLRPLLRFLYMYFIRGGALDGVPGFHYCCLISFYEYLICLKMREIARHRLGAPV